MMFSKATPSQALSELTTGFWVEDFGMVEYQTIWQRQKELVQARLDGDIGNGILIGEHFPVITMGRGSHAENLHNPTIPVLEIERGGDVTYHGPGQLIAYPIILLSEGKRDLHLYLRLLEEAVINTLAHFGISGIRVSGYTGVWIEENDGKQKKLCSIGVAVKRWVTYHGLSLNINCDLSAYQQINPCGLQATQMQTLAGLLPNEITTAHVKPMLLQELDKQLSPFGI